MAFIRSDRDFGHGVWIKRNGRGRHSQGFGESFCKLVFDGNSRFSLDFCWIVGFWSGDCFQNHFGSKEKQSLTEINK